MGGNSCGVLGLGHNYIVNEPQLIPELCNKNIKYFSNGCDFVLALTNDNKVYSWGENQVGQLAREHATDQGQYFIPGIIKHLSDEEIIQIKCGSYHSMALTADGEVIGWGDNTKGQIGSGDEQDQIKVPVNLTTESEDKFKFIECSSLSSFALTTEGKSFSWGWNENYILGNSSQPIEYKPKLIADLINIEKICGTITNTYFLNSNGFLYFCGICGEESQMQPKLIDKQFKDLIQMNSFYEENYSAIAIAFDKRLYILNENECTKTDFYDINEYYAKTFQITYQTIDVYESTYKTIPMNKLTPQKLPRISTNKKLSIPSQSYQDMFSDVYIEDNLIDLPVIKNGVTRLGDLWDGHRSQQIGDNIFKEELSEKYVNSCPIESLDYRLIESKSISKEIKIKNICEELGLELLSARISINGDVDYKTSEEHSSKTKCLICYYERETYSLFASDFSRDFLNQELIYKIINREVNATHFVRTVSLGAIYRADIKVSFGESISEDTSKVLSKLPVGKISGTLKANLALLDLFDKKDMTIKINVYSKPALDLRPKTIKDMFNAIDSIGTNVEKYKFFKDNNEIFGVPIRYQLVPIKQFLNNFNVIRVYLKLSDNIINEFIEMMVKMQDIKNSTYISQMLLNLNENLSLILYDKHSKLSKEIRSYEKSITPICVDYYQKAINLFKGYKMGVNSAEQLLSFINEFESQRILAEIRDKIDEFFEKGESHLGSIHSEISQQSEVFMQILNSSTKLNNFMADEKVTAILLKTTQKSPGGVFGQLHDMAEPLVQLGFKVGLAVPAVSSKFELIIKVNGISQCYSEDEIPFILGIIGAIVGIGFENQLLFYSIFCEVFNYKIPLNTTTKTTNILDLNALIDTLKVTQSFEVARTHLETIRLLRQMDNRYKFFIAINSIPTAVQSIRNLHNILIAMNYENVDWIVGTIDVDNTAENALLFLVHNRKVLAVCLDDYDVVLLREKFTSDSLSQFNELTPKSMEYSFYPQRVQTSESIIKAIEIHENKKLNLKSYGLNSFTEEANINATHALKLATSLVIKNSIQFIATLAEISLKSYPELESNLINAGYSKRSSKFDQDYLSDFSRQDLKKAVENIMINLNPFSAKIDLLLIGIRDINDMNNISNYEKTRIQGAIDEIKLDYQCSKDMRERIMKFDAIDDFRLKCIQVEPILLEYQNRIYDQNILHLRNLLSVLNNESESLMSEVLFTYIDRIIIHENIFGLVIEKKHLKECLEKRFYYKMMAYLVEFSQGSKYRTIHKCLEDLCNRSESRTLLVSRLLAKITDKDMFNENHWQELWKNNRFLNIIRSVINDSGISSQLISMGCETTVPVYIPDDIAEVINETRSKYKEFILPDIIENFDKFCEIFEELERRKLAPGILRTLLNNSIKDNIELRNTLEKYKILTFLKWTGNLFIEPIDLNTVREINRKIAEYNREKQELAEKEKQKSINLDQFNIKIDPDIAYESKLRQSSAGIELGQMDEEFAAVFGKNQKLIILKEFICLSHIIERPVLSGNYIKETVVKVMPYVMQKVKMWGCCALTSDSIAQMVCRDTTDEANDRLISKRPTRRRNINMMKVISPKTDEQANLSVTALAVRKATSSDKDKAPLSRLDTIVGILNNVDSIVGQDVLKIIAMFPLALPFIIRNIYQKDKYKILIPWLIQPTIKWESSPGRIIENHLFSNKFKMIVALRMGDVSAGRNGKSTILNQLFTTRNIFSCCGEAGAQGNKPVTLEGTAEMAYLIEETASSSLWESVLKSHYSRDSNELILLVNLHGNALDFRHHLKFFRTIASAYIVFEMPNNDEDIQSKYDELDKCLGLNSESENMFTMAVDPLDPGCFDDQMVIDSSKLTNDSTIDKLRFVLKNAIKYSNNILNIKAIQPDSALEWTEFIETEASDQLISYIRRKTCKEIKNNLLLQKQIEDNWATNCERIWGQNKTLKQVIQLMANVLALDVHSRQKAMLHIERELGILSSAESESARKNYSKAHNMYQKTIGDNNPNKVTLNLWRIEMNKALKEMDKTNLGLEHFYREFAKLYELSLVVDPKKSLNQYPRSYAQLLIAGQAVELLDGDTNRLSENWISAIFGVMSQLPKLRIFVVSILGLQSSGKSTLLNALFGCNFAVSVSRCTRGLLMRLLFLDTNMKEDMNFDAILLIDSEGLCAPERQNEPDSDKKDRIMATFAMGVSHLTIINILGEYMNNFDPLTEILQIAIVSMTRLEKVDICPDILLVQHLTERNSDKITNATKQFSDALENAIKIADKEDMSLGVRHFKCLNKLRNTISKGKLFHQFRPFKSGVTAYSPPSDEYHQDVVSLFKTIMDTANSSGMSINFKSWSDMIRIFWNAIKDEDFMRFKNIKELQDFLNLSGKMSIVKGKIENTFRFHSQQLRQFLNKSAEQINNNETNEERIIKKLEELLNYIPSSCTDRPCESCEQMLSEQANLFTSVMGKHYEHNVISSIQLHIKHIRYATFKHLSKILSAISFRKIQLNENYITIENRLNEELKYKRYSDYQSIQRITDEIWKQLEKEASLKVISISVIRKIDEELAHVYEQRPGFVQLCECMKNISLDKECAIDISWYQKLKSSIGFHGKNQPYNEKTGKFNPGFIYELERKLSKIPEDILSDKKVDTYREGMVAEMKRKIELIINEIEKNDKIKLDVEFKWNMTIYAVNQFKTKMETMQQKWDKLYNPLVILQSNKDEYMKWIGDRLRNGFGYHSDGSTAGIWLLSAIRQIAIKNVNYMIEKAFRNQTWTSSAEKIRLLYLSELVAEIKHDQSQKYSMSLRYFNKPKEEITKWFKKRAENIMSEKDIKLNYENIIEKEFKSVENAVKTLGTLEAKKKYIEEYISYCNGIDIRYSVSKSDEPVNDSQIFTNGIIETFERESDHILRTNVNKTDFIDLTENKSIMNLMGCTHACPLCSALCLMDAGHDQDEGETRLHHTCHQPMGFNGVHYRDTNELNVDSCHNQKHSKLWYLDHSSTNKLTFEELNKKKGYDKIWRFELHSQAHFNELMYWFFYKLQKHIAQEHALKEANEEKLRYYNMHDLAHRIDTIMANVNDAIYREDNIDLGYSTDSD